MLYSGVQKSETTFTGEWESLYTVNGQRKSVMSYLATFGHSIHLYLPGTTDELCDDHWMLLEESQQEGYLFYL